MATNETLIGLMDLCMDHSRFTRMFLCTDSSDVSTASLSEEYILGLKGNITDVYCINAKYFPSEKITFRSMTEDQNKMLVHHWLEIKKKSIPHNSIILFMLILGIDDTPDNIIKEKEKDKVWVCTL